MLKILIILRSGNFNGKIICLSHAVKLGQYDKMHSNMLAALAIWNDGVVLEKEGSSKEVNKEERSWSDVGSSRLHQ